MNDTDSTKISPILADEDGHVKDGNNILQVFLGGSCNPTTWRRNVAIPFLEVNGISYYNPQIDNWTPEVVNLERYAKQNAKVLLFVIDKQTRSTVSIVESAFMADEKSQSNIESKIKHTTTTTSTSRATSLHNHQNRNKETILESSTSSSSKSSSTSSTLISSTAQYNSTNLNSAIASETKTTTSKSSKISTSTTIQDEKGLQQTLLEANLQANSSLRMCNELISIDEFHELKQARQILQTLIAYQKIPIFTDMLHALKFVACYLKNGPDKTVNPDNRTQNLPFAASSINLNPKQVNEGSCPNVKVEDSLISISQEECMKDVYLSLDTDDHASFEATVLPILDEKGLTYNYMTVNKTLRFNEGNVHAPEAFKPQDLVTGVRPIDSGQESIIKKTNEQLVSLHSDKQEAKSSFPNLSSSPQTTTTTTTTYDLCERTKLALEREIGAIKSSRILLFVITNKCRGLSIMVIASHFMALFRNNVVLCVQYLEEPCSIGGETLTETAIADYNRGRVYLNDYAVKSQVPVFSTIQEAVECCSRKCRYYNNKS